jgi:pectate lyase
MMRSVPAAAFAVCFGALTVGVPVTFAQTYEGFGAATQGAASSPTGYSTFHVTSLADSGTGTLRDAVSQGARHIVFDVAGVIRLASDLNIYHSYTTIDGATAPAPGITIQMPGDFGINIYGRSSGRSVHDVIVHNLRVDGLSPGVATGRGDIFGMDGEDGDVYNIVLDHITGVAARDGVFDIYGRVYNVTISWNLIKDTLLALHLSREVDVKENISVHHNVFARNNERQIRLKDDSRVDYVNNVVYGWGWYGSGGKGLNIDTSYSVDPTINVVNNRFVHVNTPYGSAGSAIFYQGGTGTAKVFMSGNIVPSAETDSGTVATPMPVPAAAQVSTFSASTLGDTVVPCAGMKYPSPEELVLLQEIAAAIGGSGQGCQGRTVPSPPTNVRIIR